MNATAVTSRQVAMPPAALLPFGWPPPHLTRFLAPPIDGVLPCFPAHQGGCIPCPHRAPFEEAEQMYFAIKKQGVPVERAMRRGGGTLFFLLLAGGVWTAPVPAQVEVAPEVRQALDARRAAFEQALPANDVQGMIALYTPDALLLPPAGDTIRGREEIARDFDHPRDYRIEHEVVELTVAGEAVHELGRWRQVGTEDGAVRNGGWYSWMWVRLPDGSWHVARDLWNQGFPGG
jgi:ketosteroid isomerase-like protein